MKWKTDRGRETEGKWQKREHDDCKENQIAKLGISVAVSLFVPVKAFLKPYT